MKYKKICKCCGKEFETNSPQKLYCNGEHYLPCPICGKPVKKADNDFTRPPKCCSSECTHKLRQQKFPERKCIFCGKMFRPKSGVALVCDDVHYQPCVVCGKDIIRSVHTTKVTCSKECEKERLRRESQKKYGTDHPMQNAEIQAKFHKAMREKYGVDHALQLPDKIDQQQKAAYITNMKHNGVPYACLLPQCMEAQGKIVSNINRSVASKLQAAGVDCSLEKRIEHYSYDICIEPTKTLIEINPSYTHSTMKNHWGGYREQEYHLQKSQVATAHGYRCIHIFDWDDVNKIVKMLQPRKRIYARNCKIWKLNVEPARDFLNAFHLQGSCRGQLLCLGLVADGEIQQVMTFGKSRYEKHHDVELLRLCTRPGITVVGGASRLFSYATSEFGLNNIISYCDLAKFNGEVYEKMGMKLLRKTGPQEVWSRGTEKVTANLLRQRGFDQLFQTNFGKGTSNEELMLQHGWLPVYDCGQAVYEFK